jgi:Fe-S cluster assembly protein SufD
MSALLDAFAAQAPDDDARRGALARIVRDGLPGPRSEAWKYTSLRTLERRSFAAPAPQIAAFDDALLDGIPSPRLVFVNGRYDAAHSDVDTLPQGLELAPGALAASGERAEAQRPDAVFARLNDALADTGAVLRAAAGTVHAAPVHLVFVGAAADTDLAWHLRHRVELGDDAEVTLVEHHLGGGDHRHLDNSVCTVRLDARARLRHARVQADADGATRFLRTEAELAEGALYERLDLELGGALSRHELDVRLAGDGARLRANGVLLANGRRHLDTRLGIEHLARDTACELLWRGLGAGRGRAVFHGGITIHEGADGSDANLSNKNLLLGANAEIDTQPTLVIHADEVKAAHGATVGQLDPTAMFYLRSRGLPEADARRLLTAAFVRAPLAAVASPELREFLQARLDRDLAALVAE